jgi:ATP synthase protein I
MSPEDMSPKNGGNGPDRGEISPEERAAIRQRSSEIGKKLDVVKARRDGNGGKAKQASFGHAIEFAAYLVVGVVAGVLFGGFLDGQFGTAPWLLVLFMILGFSAGLLNVVRAAQKAQAENEASQLAAPPVPDTQDDD